MSNTYMTLHIATKDYAYLNKEVRRVFLEHHPEMGDRKVSLSLLATRAFRYYVEN